MRFLARTLIILAWLATIANAQNPFDSSQPDYPKELPFTAIEWTDQATVRVRYEEVWYDLRSIEGISVEKMVQKCKQEKWDYRRRIVEDLLQIVRLMGQETSDTVEIALIDDSGKEVSIGRAEVSRENRQESNTYALTKANPFSSGVPGYPDRSPFSAIKWKEGKPEVQFREAWYRPVSVQGVSFEAIVEKCRQEQWPLERRFTEDLVQILRLMGKDVDQTIDLELLDKDGATHRFEAVKMTSKRLRLPRESRRGDRATGKFDVMSINADLDFLQQQLESQFAYLKTNDFDYVAAIDKMRANAKEMNDESKLALAIEKKVINQFIDGHASVSGARASGDIYLPFLMEVSGARYVAIDANRKHFLDSKHPYIEQIDGKSIDEWIKIAEAYSPKGSQQYRRRHGLRTLRALPQLRLDLQLPESNTLSVVLAQEDPGKIITKELELSGDYPTYGLWPRQESSRLLDEGFGYLRIPFMNNDSVRQIQHWMPKFKDTDGLIVDVRGNGGGIRLPLIKLAGYLMRPEDDPRIGNVAKYRLCEKFKNDHLSDSRYVYRETSSKFDERERAAIVAFNKNFKPEWKPDEKEFSEWHYMVLAKRDDDKRFYYGKPVVVLCDEKCFSATDIFLGALKGWPNVTLIGQPSGGGSARSERFQLNNTGISVRCASMASFQPDGRLYDTHGVEPDVLVTRSPSYFLIGGDDVVLDQAIQTLTQSKK